MVGFFEAVYTGIQGDWTGRGVEWDGWGGKGWHPQAVSLIRTSFRRSVVGDHIVSFCGRGNEADTRQDTSPGRPKERGAISS